jgi:glycerate kinase
VPRIIVAPDSFKGTLDAADAAEAIAAGWRSVRPDDDVRTIPQADGGEGTIAAVEAATPGAGRLDAGLVTGPDGRPVHAHWLALPDGSALIELAVSSGLTLMGELDARGATTRGLGEVIRAAVEAGASSLLVATGGSASTDGGTGAVSELGARFLDATGLPLPDGGGALLDLASIDLADLLPMPPITVFTDVTAPLIGPTGAAAIFGPQKGASPDDVVALDAALGRLAEVVRPGRSANEPAPVDEQTPGGGSAGGTGYGLAVFLGAQIEPGGAAIARITGLEDAIGGADLVITGEGRYDGQSSTGKVVGHAIAACRSAGTPVAVACGSVGPGAAVGSAEAGPDELIALADLAGGTEAAIADPARWLWEAGARLAMTF